jgi:hypothetical protein
MLAEILEQLAVLLEPISEPGAILGAELVERLLDSVLVGLAHGLQGTPGLPPSTASRSPASARRTGDVFAGPPTGANAVADHDGTTYLIADVLPDRGQAVWVVEGEVVIAANSLAAELQGSDVEAEIVPRLRHCELEAGSPAN